MYDLVDEMYRKGLTHEQIIIELIKQKRTLENNMELCCSKFPNFKDEYLADIKECQQLILDSLNELDESCFEFTTRWYDCELTNSSEEQVIQWKVDLGDVKLFDNELGFDVFDLGHAYKLQEFLNK